MNKKTKNRTLVRTIIKRGKRYYIGQVPQMDEENNRKVDVNIADKKLSKEIKLIRGRRIRRGRVIRTENISREMLKVHLKAGDGTDITQAKGDDKTKKNQTGKADLNVNKSPKRKR